MMLWSALAAPGLTAAGLYLALGRGLVAESPRAIVPGLLLAACGVLVWFTEGPADRPFTGRRTRREGGAVVVVLHRWVGAAGAVVAVTAAAYAVQLATTSTGGSARAGAWVLAVVALVTMPDLLRFAARPARIGLGPDRLELRSRTHEASVPWELVVTAGLADRHPSAPGVAVTTSAPVRLRRRWLVLPLGRRSRPDRFVVPARFSDHPGEIEAAIEALAAAPVEQRQVLLDRIADDLRA